MNCVEIRRGFVTGRVPAGPAVDEHLNRCPHCHVLFENGAELGRRLAMAVPIEIAAGDLFSEVERDLRREGGLRARLRALPTGTRVASLVGAVALLVGMKLWLRRRPDFEAFSPAVFWVVLLVLGAALVLGTWSLMRGVLSPLAAGGRARWVTLSLLILPALMALIIPLGAADSTSASSELGAQTAASWGRPGSCFAYGAALVAPFLLLAWLFERRDFVPVGALVVAGALTGIAANLLLHAHCPSAHLGHLLLGHASIGVAWSLGLGLMFGRLQRAA